jgi:GHMP kinases N terminal domain
VAAALPHCCTCKRSKARRKRARQQQQIRRLAHTHQTVFQSTITSITTSIAAITTSITAAITTPTMSASPSLNKNDTRLLLTALGAGLAGAASAVLLMKHWSEKEARQGPRYGRPRDRPSLIFEDPTHEPNTIVYPFNHEEKMRRKIADRAAIEEENFQPRNSVTVRVPATSANMGPGCAYHCMQCCCWLCVVAVAVLLLVVVDVYIQCLDVAAVVHLLPLLTLALTHLCHYHLTLSRTHSLYYHVSFFIDDTIGMAVDLWSEVTVTRADTFSITAEGEGAADMPKDQSNYMVLGCKAAFEAANKPMPNLHYHVVSRIPYARGLGSSSAAIVAGIIAGLILAGHRLPCWGSEALLQIAAGIEVSTSKLEECNVQCAAWM